MILASINRFFPLKKLLNFVIIVSLSVQLILIVYNHFTGFSVITSFEHLVVRILFGTSLTIIGGLIIAVANLFVIKYLNVNFAWNTKPVTRVLIQFILSVLIATTGTSIITIISHLISPYHQGLAALLWLNGLITSVINLIIMAILEALIFFNESNQAKVKAETLEKELFHIRFEVLKNQINPHFMFNSLNVLSGLIEKDADKAQQFIDEFAHIYRYVLETIEKHVVSLADELGFVRSYIFLQQIRYGDAIRLSVNVPAGVLNNYLPPLSLQLVLENAIKHNVVSTGQPLIIDIFMEENRLVVVNNIQVKVSSGKSTGLGQKNLTKRYLMISDEVPEFSVRNNSYIVKLPLIDAEND
ncbi:MAG TPA: histidine kinase [Lentimicrobium sp.]|nr:histidine kinase [Lentimicrobium sp.]